MTQSTFTIEADQWSEHGYIYRDGQVLAYHEDRKEQRYREYLAKPIGDFLQQDDLPAEVRHWAEACKSES